MIQMFKNATWKNNVNYMSFVAVFLHNYSGYIAIAKYTKKENIQNRNLKP